MREHEGLDERLPPQNKEAERSILGAVLRDPSLFHDLSVILRKEDFYLFAHQKIWEAFVWLSDRNDPLDPVSLADRLKAQKNVQDIGGYAYIAELWDKGPTSGSAEYYAELVKSAAIKRDVIHAANEMSKHAFLPGANAKEIVEEAEKKLFAIIQRAYVSGQVVTMSEAVTETLDLLDRRTGKGKDGEIEEAVLTGWPALDALLGGLHGGEEVVVAARPSVGKTLFAMNLVGNIAATGKRVFFASLEQGRTELVSRWLCRRAQVSSKAMRKAQFAGGELDRVLDSAMELRQWGVWFDDAGGQTAARIVANARRVHMKSSLDLIVVDYLQLMESDNWGNQNEVIGANARKLKNLARELNVPLVLLSQLNRDAEKQNRRPRLSDLRGSGEIEQHADTVIVLHKSEPPDDKRDNDNLEVLVEKQRNGPLGEVTLTHRKRFFDIVSYDQAPPQNPRETDQQWR